MLVAEVTLMHCGDGDGGGNGDGGGDGGGNGGGDGDGSGDGTTPCCTERTAMTCLPLLLYIAGQVVRAACRACQSLEGGHCVVTESE